MDPTAPILVALIFFLYYLTPFARRKITAHLDKKKKASEITEERQRELNVKRQRELHHRELWDFDNDLRAAEGLPHIPYPTPAEQSNAAVKRILEKNGAPDPRKLQRAQAVLKSSPELRKAIEDSIEDVNPEPTYKPFPHHPQDQIISSTPFYFSGNKEPKHLDTVRSFVTGKIHQVWNYTQP